jgi:uncharacterized protein YbaR (Trm112 family)
MEIHDENVVCPVNGGSALPGRDPNWCRLSGRRYQIEDGLPLLFVDEHIDDGDTSGTSRTVTHNVQEFCEDAPFRTTTASTT